MILTYTHTHTHTHIHTFTHCKHTHMQTYTHTTHTCTHTSHTNAHIQHTHTNACTKHTRTSTHTHKHTRKIHKHTHIHTLRGDLKLCSIVMCKCAFHLTIQSMQSCNNWHTWCGLISHICHAVYLWCQQWWIQFTTVLSDCTCYVAGPMCHAA